LSITVGHPTCEPAAQALKLPSFAASLPHARAAGGKKFMPTYVYQGLESGQSFEVKQRITENALTHHPETGEPVKRIIQASGVVFKGSGFYKTDSRPANKDDKPDARPVSKDD
jgi:putative FmdB family regulatory protein